MTTEPDVGTQVAIKFLRNYHEFGSRVHLLAVTVLSEAIEKATDTADQKLLAIKVFSEFMSALEDLGAMSIAIRHRDEGMGLVYSFLTYGMAKDKSAPPTTLRQIYEILKSGDGLVSGLRLPPLEEIFKTHRLSSQEDIPTMYRETNIALSQAAATYLAQDHALVRAYNKTKHGFVVVSDFHTFGPASPKVMNDTAWIAARNPDYDSNPAGSSVVELFAVHLYDVRPILDRIPVIRGALMFMTELAAVLLENGLISSADSRA